MGLLQLPVWQGRFAGLSLLWIVFSVKAWVGETYANLNDGSGGAMKSLVWHDDQETLCQCLAAIIELQQT